MTTNNYEFAEWPKADAFKATSDFINEKQKDVTATYGRSLTAVATVVTATLALAAFIVPSDFEYSKFARVATMWIGCLCLERVMNRYNHDIKKKEHILFEAEKFRSEIQQQTTDKVLIPSNIELFLMDSINEINVKKYISGKKQIFLVRMGMMAACGLSLAFALASNQNSSLPANCIEAKIRTAGNTRDLRLSICGR